MKVAVIGAGVMGCAAAWALAKRGHKVSVFEQFQPGHRMGSSHGRSRIVRLAYPDAFYTRIMAEAYPLWGSLQSMVSEQFLFEPGLLYFGREDSADLQSMAKGLEEVGEPMRIYGAASVGDVAPELVLLPGEIGVFTPRAGWVNADVVLRVLRTLSEQLGGEFRYSERASEPPKGFDLTVLCPGSWIRQWVGLPVQVTLQTVAYFHQPQSGPVWIEDGPDFVYGFPNEPGLEEVKLGAHNLRQPFDTDFDERPLDEDSLARMRETLERRFGVGEPLMTDAYSCLYTSTADEDFLFGRLNETTVFASACSGHGFKFALWIGERLADLAEGENRIPDRFWFETP